MEDHGVIVDHFQTEQVVPDLQSAELTNLKCGLNIPSCEGMTVVPLGIVLQMNGQFSLIGTLLKGFS